MANITPPTVKELEKRFGAGNVKSMPGATYAVALVPPSEDRRKLAAEYAKAYGGKVDMSSTWTGKAVLFPNGKRLSFKPKMGNAGGAAKDGEIILSQFKPSQIPDVCNKWQTPEAMLERVEKFIRGPKFPGTAKAAYLKFLTEVTQDQKLAFTVVALPPDVSSELFEILLAIKLARLLSNNDRRIKGILGLTTKSTTRQIKKSDVKIYIPLQANFPLVDFFVSYAPHPEGAPSRADTKGNCLISVKAKRGAASASNTVKFGDMFEQVSEVDRFVQKRGKEQRRQAACAGAAISSQRGMGTQWPLPAFAILAGMTDARPKLEQDYKAIMPSDGPTFTEFAKAVQKLAPGGKLHSEAVTQKQAADFGGKRPIAGLNPRDVAVMKAVINTFWANSKTTGTRSYNIPAIAYVCEKVLEVFSQQDSASKVNFYPMFYDRVLVEHQVAYAVAKIHATKNQAEVKFEYYAAQNFDSYLSWVPLRSKNAISRQADALGLAV